MKGHGKVQTTHKPSDYVWIQRWGQELGSNSTYIKDEQLRAARDNAPIGAIYKRDDQWRTIHDVSNAITQLNFEQHYQECCEPGFWNEVE